MSHQVPDAEPGEEIFVSESAGADQRFVLRPLRPTEYPAGESLQAQVWGDRFTDLVPASMMMIAQKIGGVVAGAFDERGELCGLVYGLTGLSAGQPLHWSHILAVRPDLRGEGLGRALKLLQRRYLLGLGVTVAQWTFDPLESRNAHINLRLLGAEPIEYRRDVYPGSRSELHRGIGTDRLVIEWRLDSPRVEQAIAGEGEANRWAKDPAVHRAPVANIDRGGRPLAPPFDLPSDCLVRVAIPAQIQAIKSAALDIAQLWRAATRHAFEGYLARGYRVVSFYRKPREPRGFYILQTSP